MATLVGTSSRRRPRLPPGSLGVDGVAAVFESAMVFSAVAVACAIALHVAGIASSTIVALTFLTGLVVGCAQPLVRHQVAVHRVTVIARSRD